MRAERRMKLILGPLVERLRVIGIRVFVNQTPTFSYKIPENITKKDWNENESQSNFFDQPKYIRFVDESR